jgi:tRNA dimethylallyltransferase
MTNKPPLLVVLGPTSSGKSDLAVFLAQQYNGEVISADSRQVYKGMDIGTGKITKEEMQGVPHHLLSYVDPQEPYSLSRWHKDATECIEDITRRGKLPIICGGTGFYIESIVDGVVPPEVPPDSTLREELEQYSTEELYSRLQELDIDRAHDIDQHNRVRLIRAIEIATHIGNVPKRTPTENKYEIYQIGLSLPKEELMNRVQQRLIKRIDQGMIEEVQRLHDSGVSWERLISFGLEYKYCALHLMGTLTREELVQELLIKTWQYAKRQITWFKRDTRIHWYTPEQRDVVQKEVEKFLFDTQ